MEELVDLSNPRHQQYISVRLCSLIREAQVFLGQVSNINKSTVSNLKPLEMCLGILNLSYFRLCLLNII